MATVILHVGDTVTHSSLGEGVVTIVDEEFVTIQFASGELTFRLPDAFRKGFLSSDDAEIIGDLNDEDYDDDDGDDDDNEDDEDDEEEDDDDDDDEISEITPSAAPDPKKDNIGGFGVAIAVIVPLLFVGPFIWLFGSLYSDGLGGLFLFLTIFAILFYITVVYLTIKTYNDPIKTTSTSRYVSRSSYRPRRGYSSYARKSFWGSSRKKSKSIFDGLQDDLYWQRKHSSHRW